MEKRAILKEGRERSLGFKHPWVFSGALESLPLIEPGEILPLHSISGRFIGMGYFHPAMSLTGRIITFDLLDPHTVIQNRLKEAFLLKKNLYPDSNAFRWINAEGDGIPGLIIDWYGGIAVLQVHTAGIERMKSKILGWIQEIANPTAIYERSNSSSRKLEGLEPIEKWHLGMQKKPILIQEECGQFLVSIEDGQKTGFFLDQREARTLVGKLSKGKKVLNTFGYTGGFTVAALLKGATFVDHVDVDGKALELLKETLEINQIPQSKVSLRKQDVFAFLKNDPLDHDVFILDPPAFAKKLKDKEEALKGYTSLHSLVFAKAKPGALIHTSSCSYFVDEDSFTKTIFQASLLTNREISILSAHHGALDHPHSIYCPEGKYLKSYLLCVRN